MTNAAQISKNTKNGGSVHAVAFGDLHVMIICDSETEWYAQGLEVDYLAQGETKETVQDAFSRGLRATIKEHLKLHGDILKLLRPADPNVWAEFYRHTTGAHFSFTQISVHELEMAKHERVLVAHTKAGKPKPEQPRRTNARAQRLPFKRIAFIEACAP